MTLEALQTFAARRRPLLSLALEALGVLGIATILLWVGGIRERLNVLEQSVQRIDARQLAELEHAAHGAVVSR